MLGFVAALVATMATILSSKRGLTASVFNVVLRQLRTRPKGRALSAHCLRSRRSPRRVRADQAAGGVVEG
jgi:hypothetical protein